jgi:hypothetical protein
MEMHLTTLLKSKPNHEADREKTTKYVGFCSDVRGMPI